jgi:hypothetical protein
MGGELSGWHRGVTRGNSLRPNLLPGVGNWNGSLNTADSVLGARVFALTPRLGCIPGIAAGPSDLDCRAVEILDYWRIRESALPPKQDMRSATLNHAAAAVQVGPEPVAAGFKPRLGLAPPLLDALGGRSKLALEFARPPGYPETTVTAVPAVSTMGRDIKRHQILTIA